MRSSLTLRGAIRKRSAADSTLFEIEGKAAVFSSLTDLRPRGDDPGLDLEDGDILVLRNAWPGSQPGLPEAGCLPIPKRLATAGARDLVRISNM